jgi:hypothetical protein
MYPVTDPKAQRGSRGIALLFLDLGARRGGWSAPRPGRFTPGKDPVPIVQEAGWAPGPVWTGAKYLSPTGIRSPDRPARSQSLYRGVVWFGKYSSLVSEEYAAFVFGIDGMHTATKFGWLVSPKFRTCPLMYTISDDKQ